MPLSYYMKKYFSKDKKDKFVYPDCWGDIVLRNEAWILLKDIIPLIKTENEVIAAQKILKLQQQERKYSHINSNNECEWKNFWERVVKYIRNTLEENNLLWVNIVKPKCKWRSMQYRNFIIMRLTALTMKMFAIRFTIS